MAQIPLALTRHRFCLRPAPHFIGMHAPCWRVFRAVGKRGQCSQGRTSGTRSASALVPFLSRCAVRLVNVSAFSFRRPSSSRRALAASRPLHQTERSPRMFDNGVVLPLLRNVTGTAHSMARHSLDRQFPQVKQRRDSHDSLMSFPAQPRMSYRLPPGFSCGSICQCKRSYFQTASGDSESRCGNVGPIEQTPQHRLCKRWQRGQESLGCLVSDCQSGIGRECEQEPSDKPAIFLTAPLGELCSVAGCVVRTTASAGR